MGMSFWRHFRKERTSGPRSIYRIRGGSRMEPRRVRRRWSTPHWPRTFWNGPRSDPHEWTLVLSEDDDVVPPVFTAETWMKPYGGCVLIVRTRRSSRPFLKLGGIVKEVNP